ncbi:retrovirus-related pol polyprotein from transposon TNT 1-94, partial [Tanacetum coccineum]
EAALNTFPETTTDDNKTAALKTGVHKKAHNALILCLVNKVLSEVNKVDSVAGIWLKLKTLYMTKSLANKLYLKKKLFTFYMHSGKKLSEHIDEFNKLIGDLVNIDVDIDDQNQALMEWKKRTYAKDDGDGLFVRRRSDHRGSTEELLSKKNKKKSTGFLKENVGQGSGMHYEGHDNGDLLMSMIGEMFLEWIMDSGGSYHMTPRRDFLFDFKEFNGGTVLPGDNRACVVMGTGKVRVQMIYGSSFVLENLCYIPKLKRNLISLGTLDREGYTVKLWNGRINVIKGSLMVFSGTMKENYEYSLDDLVASSEASFEKREVLGNKGLGKLEVCKNYVLGKSTRDFNNLCKESGISKHLTVAGTLQHNGQAERMNRLWRLDDVKPKIIISMDVVFNESLMYKDTLKGVGATDSRKKVKFEMELKGSRVEETMNPHTGENPGNEDKEQDNEEPQQ